MGQRSSDNQRKIPENSNMKVINDSTIIDTIRYWKDINY